MEYSLVFLTAEGEAAVLMSSKIHPQLMPLLALRVSALQEYIPNIRIVTADHEMTALVFERGNVKLQGEPVQYFQGIDN